MAKVAEATVRLSLEDKLTKPLTRIQNQFKAFSKNIGFNRIAASTKNLTKSLQGLNKGFSKSVSRLSKLTALLGLGGGGLAASLYGLSKNTAQMAMELGDTAKQLGIGVVPLQLWQHAAERSGVGVEKFNSALAQLNKKSAEAAAGSKSAAAAFKELGISVLDSSGHLKSSDQLMEEVTASMGKIGSQGARQRLAAQLFGGDGKEMAAMLSGGMQPINELFDEKRSFGNLIGQDVVDSGGGFMTSLDQLKGHLNGIKTLLAVHLMPVVHDIIKAVRDWIIENKELIKSGIAEWCGRLRKLISDLMNPTSNLRQNIDSWVTSFQNFYEKVSPVVDFLGGPMKVVLGALAIFIAGPLIAALYSAATAFVSLGIAIMTTPVGWIAAGIAAIVAAVYLLYQNCEWFRNFWDSLWGRITAAFDKGFIQGILTLLYEFHPVALIARAIDAIFEYFTGISLHETGWEFMKSLYRGIVAAFKSIWEFFSNISSALWQAILGDTSELKNIGAKIIDFIWEGLKAGWNNVVAWFSSALDSLIGWLPDSVREAMGFKVNVQPTMQGMEAVNGTVSHSVEAMQAINNPYDIPELRPKEPAYLKYIKEHEQSKQGDQIQAEQMQVERFEVPEPLMVHKPTEIDTSVTIQNLTVQSSGTPEDVSRAIARAMAGISQNQGSNVNAALND